MSDENKTTILAQCSCMRQECQRLFVVNKALHEAKRMVGEVLISAECARLLGFPLKPNLDAWYVSSNELLLRKYLS